MSDCATAILGWGLVLDMEWETDDADEEDGLYALEEYLEKIWGVTLGVHNMWDYAKRYLSIKESEQVVDQGEVLRLDLVTMTNRPSPDWEAQLLGALAKIEQRYPDLGASFRKVHEEHGLGWFLAARYG